MTVSSVAPVRGLPGVYLTPHRAGGLITSVQRNVHWLIDDLEAHGYKPLVHGSWA